MEARPFFRVLVIAALLGVGLGGAAFGVQRLVAPPTASGKTTVTTIPVTQKATTGTKPSTSSSTNTAMATSTASATATTPFGTVSGGRSTMSGTVSSAKDGLITLTKIGGGSVNVTTWTGTVFQKQGPGSLADLVAGLPVSVEGTSQSDGSIKATSITTGSANARGGSNQALPTGTAFPSPSVLPPGQGGGGFTRAPGTNLPETATPGSAGAITGTIQSVTGNTIMLRTLGGTSVSVFVGPTTSIQKVSSASQTDITEGASLIVTGTMQGDGSLQATDITITTTR
jgi:hypothetical protein